MWKALQASGFLGKQFQKNNGQRQLDVEKVINGCQKCSNVTQTHTYSTVTDRNMFAKITTTENEEVFASSRNSTAQWPLVTTCHY